MVVFWVEPVRFLEFFLLRACLLRVLSRIFPKKVSDWEIELKHQPHFPCGRLTPQLSNNMVSLTFLWNVLNGLLTGTWYWTWWNTGLIQCGSSYILFSVLLMISIMRLAKALFKLSPVVSKVSLNRVKKASMAFFNQGPQTVARTVWPNYSWHVVLQTDWNSTISHSSRHSRVVGVFVRHVWLSWVRLSGWSLNVAYLLLTS